MISEKKDRADGSSSCSNSGFVYISSLLAQFSSVNLRLAC